LRLESELVVDILRAVAGRLVTPSEAGSMVRKFGSAEEFFASMVLRDFLAGNEAVSGKVMKLASELTREPVGLEDVGVVGSLEVERAVIAALDATELCGRLSSASDGRIYEALLLHVRAPDVTDAELTRHVAGIRVP